MKKIIKILIIGLTVFYGCTDLKEEILDETTGEENLVYENLYELVAPSYNSFLDLYFIRQVWGIQEVTTDEMMIPTRGTDWFDGGIWQMHYLHTWIPQHEHIMLCWNALAKGMARANYSLFLIEDFEESDDVKYFRAELNFLKCLYMYYYMDIFGKVPYREYTEENFGKNPRVFNREQAFNYIVKKINEIKPSLGDKYVVPYGRPNKDAATMLLAKLYLNKEVYTGEPAYDSCLIYVNEILNSGRYAIADDYFQIFGPDNDLNYTNNDEAILVTVLNDDPQMYDYFWHEVYQLSFHYNQNPGGGYGGGYNGLCTQKEYLEKIIAHTDTSTDVRWHGDKIYDTTGIYCGFNYGQQYGWNGKKLYDRSGNPLIYTFEAPLDTANETNGVRVMKYWLRIPCTCATCIPNDFVVWRYSDCLLMQAECNLRLGNANEALTAVNNLREKRHAPLLSSIDLPSLLTERAIELYCECHRRQDMIRFGTFLDPKADKPEPSPESRLVCPIPQDAIDAIGDKSILSQNPGY
jgi:hypothetical protein